MGEWLGSALGIGWEAQSMAGLERSQSRLFGHCVMMSGVPYTELGGGHRADQGEYISALA